MHRRSLRPYLVALGLLWVAPAVLVLALHLLLPDHNASGQCTGLGFGCTPPPSDMVILLGYLAALPLLVLGLVACLVIAVVQARRGGGEQPDDQAPTQRSGAGSESS